ncbi:MAG: polysaccharide deacetylase family protein [Gemmataceae bacterium]|nr:polysaccharide deacetylase family protein [Gemmataceae bacterium]
MSDWKHLLRAALCGAYKWSGAMRLHEALARRAGQRFLSVLLFHRVTDLIPEDGLTVHPERFRRMCRMLRSFNAVPLDEVFAIVRDGRPMPPRTLAITFDDCYLDNLAAARVLADHGLPATFFIPTAAVGTDHAFPWDAGLPKLPNLAWDQVRAIARLGHAIGSHTVTHCDLGAVDAGQAWRELTQSKARLEDEVRQPVRWLAYPFGGRHNLRPEYRALIHEAGYEGAVSAYGGFVHPGTDPRLLPREAVPWFKSLWHLEMHLSGCLHWLYDLRGRDHATPTRPGATPHAACPVAR